MFSKTCGIDRTQNSIWEIFYELFFLQYLKSYTKKHSTVYEIPAHLCHLIMLQPETTL